MSNNKMKGLLKGLRYISQIFDNEKEPEMQIGFPTDVKHVAHIGWDGPSVNSPSWMNEFKHPNNGDIKQDASAQCVSQDSKRDMAVTSRDMPELPKSSKRQSSTVGGSVAESPTMRDKSEKVKSKKSSKARESSSSDNIGPSRRNSDLNQGSESPTESLPGVPKKGRRKKSKEEGSTKSRSKATAAETCSSQFSNNASDVGSISRSNDDDLLTGDGVFT
ncbi:hypothetical protein Csa_011162 [Cucumis sativus]|uniref:CRIB domain-containing protein n=1 Tax=Cucumis sativus TaxID=3659 RepID=A0A0A0L7D1_CUCSA|nr:hypothetical protein Csa_011162 [Cucumis sativus]